MPQPPVVRHSSISVLFSVLLLILSACALPAGSSSPPATSPVPTPTEPVLAPPASGTYAALGASETFGVGAQPVERGYAYLVSHALHAHRFVNLGIPGTTLSSGYQTELTGALSIRPSLCTVFFGVNDLRAGVGREAFLSNLHDLVATLRSAHSQVLIIGLPDLAHVPAVEALHIPGIEQIVRSWNNGMASIARETGSHFLDLHAYSAELANHRNYIAPDGLHPSTIGHRRLAAVVLHAIRQDGIWRRS